MSRMTRSSSQRGPELILWSPTCDRLQRGRIASRLYSTSVDFRKVLIKVLFFHSMNRDVAKVVAIQDV